MPSISSSPASQHICEMPPPSPQSSSKPPAPQDLACFEPELASFPADNTRIETHGSSHAQPVAFVEGAEHAEHSEQGGHHVTPEKVLTTHGTAMAIEHGVHHAIEHAAHKAGTRAVEHAATHAAERTIEHVAAHTAGSVAGRVATNAAGHAAGEVAAHGLGRVGSVVAPGIGAVAAGYLAYQSFDHAIDAADKGHTGAAISYSVAGTIDAATAAVNGFGAATGAGTLISTPASVVLGVAATGFAALGAYLDH